MDGLCEICRLARSGGTGWSNEGRVSTSGRLVGLVLDVGPGFGMLSGPGIRAMLEETRKFTSKNDPRPQRWPAAVQTTHADTAITPPAQPK